MTVPPFNILIGYPYYSRSVHEVVSEWDPGMYRWLLDSGAFQAWSKGASVTLDDYCRFLDKHIDRTWRYMMLDVIGDPDATKRNYDEMLRRGYNPIPIFTRGESIETLESFYSQSDMVAVGGLVRTDRNKGYVKGIMQHIGDRKVHWLGFTAFAWMKRYRPYSVDSSSYTINKYPSFSMYLGRGKETRSQYKKTVLRARPGWFVACCERAGVDPDRAFSRDPLVRSQAWLHLGEYNWLERSLDTEMAIGTKLFLCVTGASAAKRFIGHYERYGDRLRNSQLRC